MTLVSLKWKQSGNGDANNLEFLWNWNQVAGELFPDQVSTIEENESSAQCGMYFRSGLCLRDPFLIHCFRCCKVSLFIHQHLRIDAILCLNGYAVLFATTFDNNASV